MKMMINRCLLVVICCLINLVWLPQVHATLACGPGMGGACPDTGKTKAMPPKPTGCIAQIEICDGKDNDCDTLIDEDMKDVDKDGICDEIDPVVAKPLPPSIKSIANKEPTIVQPLKRELDLTAVRKATTPEAVTVVTKKDQVKVVEPTPVAVKPPAKTSSTSRTPSSQTKEEKFEEKINPTPAKTAVPTLREDKSKQTVVERKAVDPILVPKKDEISLTDKRKNITRHDDKKEVIVSPQDKLIDQLREEKISGGGANIPLVDPNQPGADSSDLMKLADYECGGQAIQLKCEKTYNVADDECARCYNEDKSTLLSVSGEACDDIHWNLPGERDLTLVSFLKEPVRQATTDEMGDLMVVTDRQFIQMDPRLQIIRKLTMNPRADLPKLPVVELKQKFFPEPEAAAIYKIMGSLAICKVVNPSACESGGEPSEEVCDGIDNDCDGDVDNVEFPVPDTFDCHLLKSCVEGKIEEREVCVDPVLCEGGVQPSEEICDGKDNDCDGEIDNDIAAELVPVVCGKDLQEVACVDGLMVTRPLAEVMVSALSVDMGCGPDPKDPAKNNPKKTDPNANNEAGGSAATDSDGGGCNLSTGSSQSMPLWFLALLTIPALALGYRRALGKRL